MKPQHKPVALVLGGVAPHARLAQLLGQKGFHTVLVDYKDRPPAVEHCDEHVQESTLDREKVLEIAKRYRAKVIATICLDQPIPVAAWVCEKLGIPFYLSYEQALQVTNKQLMKSVLSKAGVATPHWTFIEDINRLPVDALDFPVVVKPSNGTGSLGVFIARDQASLLDNIGLAATPQASEGLIMEAFIEGQELSVDCFVSEGRAHVLLLRERHKTWNEAGTELQCHATVSPAQVHDDVRVRIAEIVQMCSDTVGLRNGPLLVQMVIRDDGNIFVLEIAARLGGGPGAARTVEMLTGFDYAEAATNAVLGRPVKIDVQDSTGFCAAHNLYADKGTFSHVQGLESARKLGLVEEYFLYKPGGTDISDHLSARSRVAAFVIRGQTRAELREKAQELLTRHLDVLDMDGRSILRRDIGLHTTLN